MNAKQLIAVSAIAFLGSQAAWAQEASSDAWMQAESTKSRAEVRAETAPGSASVAIGGGEASVFAERAAASTRSRDAVRAEARANPRRFAPDVHNVGA